jgi:hypothetical protein
VFYKFTTGTFSSVSLELSNIGVSSGINGTYYYALYTGACASPVYAKCGQITLNTPLEITGLATNTNYLLRIYIVNAVSTNLGNFNIKVTAPYVWTGANGSDWGDGGNWLGGTVPNSSSATVIIPAVSDLPEIGAATEFSVNNITINASASLRVYGSIKIAGTVTNSGIFDVTNGTVEYNGTAIQTIAANTFYNNTIKNLTINKTISNLTLGGALSLTGTLTPTAGGIVTTGYLTLVSNASGTARIAAGPSTGNYIIGSVTTQRYIPGGYRKYRFLSHPLSAGATLSQFTDDIDITGSISGTNANGFTVTGSNAPSAFSFIESADNGLMYGSGSNAGWAPYTSTSTATTISAGNAIRVMVRGYKSQPGTLNGAGATPLPVTLDFLGALTQGSLTKTLSYSSANTSKGWNLVGNPYPSNISWASLTKNSLDNSIYIYRPSTGSYASYVNGSATNGGSDVIESGIGFFVKANGPTPYIIFNETSKVANEPSATMFRSSKSITDRIKLSLKDAGSVEEGDEVVVRFGVDKASDEFDADYDAYDLAGGTYNLFAVDAKATHYSIFHGSKLNAAASENRSVALGYTVSKAGTYQIDATILDAFTQNNIAYLYDANKATYTKIENGASYTFDVEAGAIENTTRFSIVFNAKRVAQPQETKPQFAVAPNPATGKTIITFRNGAALATTVTISTIDGKVLKTINAGILSEGNLTLPLTGLTQGVYIVQVMAGKSISHTKLVVQ